MTHFPCVLTMFLGSFGYEGAAGARPSLHRSGKRVATGTPRATCAGHVQCRRYRASLTLKCTFALILAQVVGDVTTALVAAQAAGESIDADTGAAAGVDSGVGAASVRSEAELRSTVNRTFESMVKKRYIERVVPLDLSGTSKVRTPAAGRLAAGQGGWRLRGRR